MKRKIIIIVFLILIIVVAFLLFLNISSKLNSNEQNVLKELNLEKETKYNYKAFQPSFSTSYEGSNSYDFSQDMIYNNKIYYKKINSYEEYKIVKERWNDILDMNESDFNDKFMVITAVENESMIGLTVDNVEADNSSLYISLIHYDKNQKYNENETCISYIISRDLERENIYVTRNFQDFEKDMSNEMQIANLNDSFGTVKNFTYQYKHKYYRDAYKREREENKVDSNTKLVPVDWKDYIVQNFTIDKDMKEVYISNNWNDLGDGFYSITLTKHSDYLKMVNNYNTPNLYWNEFEYIFAIIVFRMDSTKSIKASDILNEEDNSYINVSVDEFIKNNEENKYPAMCIILPNYRSSGNNPLNIRLDSNNEKAKTDAFYQQLTDEEKSKHPNWVSDDYYFDNSSTGGIKTISEENAIKVWNQFRKDVLSNDTEKYKVKKVSKEKVKPTNALTAGTNWNTKEADFERDAYVIYCNDDSDLEKIVGYVDMYTGKVIGGFYGGV